MNKTIIGLLTLLIIGCSSGANNKLSAGGESPSVGYQSRVQSSVFSNREVFGSFKISNLVLTYSVDFTANNKVSSQLRDSMPLLSGETNRISVRRHVSVPFIFWIGHYSGNKSNEYVIISTYRRGFEAPDTRASFVFRVESLVPFLILSHENIYVNFGFYENWDSMNFWGAYSDLRKFPAGIGALLGDFHFDLSREVDWPTSIPVVIDLTGDLKIRPGVNEEYMNAYRKGASFKYFFDTNVHYAATSNMEIFSKLWSQISNGVSLSGQRAIIKN